MASGWDGPTKKVIRDNGRNVGSTIWQLDTAADQVVDDLGHDTNDQTLADSITETLNINGINNMLADLDVGTNGLVNVGAGGVDTDGVNLGQVNTAIAALGTALETEIVVTSFKSDGPIRHVLSVQPTGATAAIPVDTHNRHHVINPVGGVELQFTGQPVGADPDLGDDYQAEGSIVVWNDATAGAVTVSGITPAPRVIGSPNTTGDASQVLSYLMQMDGGTLYTTLIWSAG